jgi:hypothetical protein
MQALADELMRSCRQTLQHIGHATGFLDANLSDAAGFEMKRPKGVDVEHDLLDDLHSWFGAHAAQTPAGSEAEQAMGLLRRMREAPNRVYLRPPDPDHTGRSAKDELLLLTTRLVRNLQAVHELDAERIELSRHVLEVGGDVPGVEGVAWVLGEDARAGG